MPRGRSLIGLVAVAVLCGCGGSSNDATEGPVPTADPGGASDGDGATFRVQFETSAGDFIVEVHPDWAPLGAARFRKLVEDGYFDGNQFFRVVPEFVVQWGINGNPAISSQWREQTIQDEPVREGNTRGRMTFAKGGPDSRTTQVFVNLKDNTFLDAMGFPAFGEVVEGMEVFDAINAEYGEQPDQRLINQVGDAYLDRDFPNLDYIERATIVEKE